MPRMEQLDLFGGEPTPIYTKKEWLDMFVEHCNKIYEERGGKTGEYCCGYHWCCDECKMKLCNGCADCVATIIKIYESFGYEIDSSDIDFDNFEQRARELYESNTNKH